MSRVERELERQARAYMRTLLLKTGTIVSLSEALAEVEAAHRRRGTAVCGDFYIGKATRDRLLEDAYDQAGEEEL